MRLALILASSFLLFAMVLPGASALTPPVDPDSILGTIVGPAMSAQICMDPWPTAHACDMVWGALDKLERALDAMEPCVPVDADC